MKDIQNNSWGIAVFLYLRKLIVRQDNGKLYVIFNKFKICEGQLLFVEMIYILCYTLYYIKYGP